MASPFDPYRVLGLPAGASIGEIKRAYRRLAKAYHPDSAGPAATPRFLAIQEAYDLLTQDGGRDPGATRGPRSGGGTRPAGSAPGAAGGAGAGAGPFRRRRPGAAPEPGAAPFGSRRRGSSSAAGPAGSAGAGGAGWWQRRPRRAPNRAILGSTTYDDAGEPEPEWEGASWYGQATGTYWTINPREYADPRKHGPEYQARARRLAAEAGFEDGGLEDGAVDGDVDGAAMPDAGEQRAQPD